jgi:hypothetical protein
MDGSISGNQRFRLNENGTINNDGKLFIFVKLTDSCMKTIETYLKQNKKSNKSNIKFNSNGGVTKSFLFFSFKFILFSRKYQFQLIMEKKKYILFKFHRKIKPPKYSNVLNKSIKSKFIYLVIFNLFYFV